MSFIFTNNSFKVLIKSGCAALSAFHIGALPGLTGKLTQLPVANFVFRQKNEVPILVGVFIFVFVYKINLVTEDNLKVRMFFTYFIPTIQSFNMTTNNFVVSDRQTIKAVFNGFVNHFRDTIDGISQM